MVLYGYGSHFTVTHGLVPKIKIHNLLYLRGNYFVGLYKRARNSFLYLLFQCKHSGRNSSLYFFQRMGSGSDANKPVANVSLMSIGKLGLNENKKHSGNFLSLANSGAGLARAKVPSENRSWQLTYHD